MRGEAAVRTIKSLAYGELTQPKESSTHPSFQRGLSMPSRSERGATSRMRVRRLIASVKQLETDTDWQKSDLQPRYAQIFPKTTPIRAGWRWRSARASGAEGQYVLLAKCNPPRDNWKAFLIMTLDEGASVVGRFEHHGSHPGLHAHAHCERSGIEAGPRGLDDLVRIPAAGNSIYHRRKNAWSENSFWEAAKRFFRVQEKTGPLL